MNPILILLVVSCSNVAKTSAETTANRGLAQLDSIILTTVDISDCLARNGQLKLNLTNTEGRITYRYSRNKNWSRLKEQSTCSVHSTAPVGSSIWVLVLEQSCVKDNAVAIQEMTETSGTWAAVRSWDGCERGLSPGLDYVTKDRHAFVAITVGNWSAPLFVRLSIRPVSRRRNNQVRLISNSTGYIQSFGFDPGTSLQHLDDRSTDSRTEVGVPSGHVTMLSAVHAITRMGNCRPTNFLSLRAGWDNTTHSASPQKLRTGSWNCSSSTYPHFRLHLLCNFRLECDGGQDEARCAHTPCSHSGVLVEGRCFFRTPIAVLRDTWHKARAWCVRHGARLATLSTPATWRQVPWLLRLDWFNGEFNYAAVGLTTSPSTLPAMYKDILQWQDTTMAYPSCRTYFWRPSCARLVMSKTDKFLRQSLCYVHRQSWAYHVCEKEIEPRPSHASTRHPLPPIQRPSELVLAKLQNRTRTTPVLYLVCRRGHLLHTFLACDPRSACFSGNDVTVSDSREFWARPTRESCGAGDVVASLPPLFACGDGAELVPYTLVCDHRPDCLDNSDENFCVFPPGEVTWEFQCDSPECVPLYPSCTEDSPEPVIAKAPAEVTLDGRGSYLLKRLPREASTCRDSYFKCPSNGYCMPIFVRCNGVNDCPEKEDEEGCDDSTGRCAGFYRCRGFLNTCMHPEHLCDGRPQCPQHDDERFCNLPCPVQCSCLGHSWFCRQIFLPHLYLQIRFLDAGNSGMELTSLKQNNLLIHLGLWHCGVTRVKNITLPNLRSLDLHGNHIRAVSHAGLKGFPNLKTLFVSGNPLSSVFKVGPDPHLFISKLTHLDLSAVEMNTFDPSFLASFPNLQTLNLSGCGIETVTRQTFRFVPKLRVLDFRGCPLKYFPDRMLKPLPRLVALLADNFKVCCPNALPDNFHSRQCESPEDVVASCSDLFKSNLYRVSWHVTASLTLLCNVALLCKRALPIRGSRQPGGSMHGSEGSAAVDVFVTSLFACGCIHAVYMAIVGMADVTLHGSYARKDIAWRHGPLCALAGFLWLLSLEWSLLLLSLLTLDRVLVSWPSCTPRRFSAKSAKAAVFLSWAGGILIASVPLLPLPPQWEVFQQTALCSPTILGGQLFPSQPFVSGVISVFNVTLSWLVGIGQVAVYLSLNRDTFAFVHSPHQTKRLRASRRVMGLAILDVAHWLVIGHAGHVVVAAGTVVSDDVAAVARVIVIPFVWALKPAVHVAVTLLERRRRHREGRLLKMLIAKGRS